MSVRYFTADFHFGGAVLLDKDVMGENVRPFESLNQMHARILSSCARLKKDDTLYHIGDLAYVGKDRCWTGLDCKPTDLLDGVDCTKIFLEGNHDAGNDVKTHCRCMLDYVGSYACTIQHWPSTCSCAHIMDCGNLNINICGHVHNAWKIYFDQYNRTLNVNVGVDRNNFKIYSENELVSLIDSGIAWLKECKKNRDFVSYDFWRKTRDEAKKRESMDKKARTEAWLKTNKPWLLKTPEENKQ